MEKIKFYTKLIRDRMPEIIQSTGNSSKTDIAETEEYLQKLQEKLEEEVKEFLSAEEKEKIGEIADILEVLYAICPLSRRDARSRTPR